MDDLDILAGLPPMIRASDLAEFLDVDVQQLADWRKKKKGPPFTKLIPGRGSVRYPREGLRRYLAQINDKQTPEATA